MDNLQQLDPSNGSSPSTTLDHAQAVPQRRFRFRKCSHVRLQKDFERVYAQKAAYNDGTVLVYVGFNDQGRLRLGMSVGKKVGNAVKRNRWKRLLREAFRLQEREITQEAINKLKRAKSARISEIQKREKLAAKAGLAVATNAAVAANVANVANAANVAKSVSETLCADPGTPRADNIAAASNSIAQSSSIAQFPADAANSVQQIESIAIPESAQQLGIDIIAIPRAVIRPTLQMVKKSLRYSVKRAVVKLYGFEPSKREK